MADFSINKAIDTMGDIQRTYSWLLEVPDLPVGMAEQMQVRCRTVSLPGRSNEVITSNYGGMEMHFPGRLKYTNPFNITLEETENRAVATFIANWQDNVFQPALGGGQGKRQAFNVHLQLLDYAGNPTEGKQGRITFFNAWPESVAEVALSYAENSAIQYALALRYDYWEYTGV